MTSTSRPALGLNTSASIGGEGERGKEGENLMQRTGRRKRGSPEPAPHSAGSTATFSWRTLQPPRGTPGARGRGRTADRGRPTIPKAKARPSNLEICTEEESGEEQEREAVEEETPGEGAPATTLPDDEEILNREEHYQRLRRAMGVSNNAHEEEAALGFSSRALDEVQNLKDPLTAGELLARLGHFLRIVSQMMEEVGYMAELIAQGHRPTPEEEGDETNLVQGTKRFTPASYRRRAPGEDEGAGVPNGEEPASSANIPGTTGERSTREDPIPREERLTAEDWAIMAAVERCAVWRALKAFNLRQREKLLAAMCLVVQETVEGNEERTTVHGPEDFRDWGRRWGQYEQAAHLILQHQWDNLLRHVMGITAAMEVWEPSTV